MRIGHGYDLHRLVEGRELVLCGVKIPHIAGLLGHSDADVAVHALMDAMLGAAAMGDIGRHFPDSDENYRDIASTELLLEVAQKLYAQGYRLHNADITIIAQRPRLSGYMPEMTETLCRVLNTDIKNINIKATTEEGLGATGNGTAIAAHAVCTIVKNEGE